MRALRVWVGSWYLNMTKMNIVIVSHDHFKSLYMDIERQTPHKFHNVAQLTNKAMKETGEE